MAASLRVVLWNENGLSNHKLELQTFLTMYKIDIALVSETHFTYRSAFTIPHYTVYRNIYADDTAHGGPAVIIRSSIRNHEPPHHQSAKIQATTVQLEAHPWPMTISAIYCPPRHTIPTEDYTMLFRSLGARFLIGGDWNAKHTAWGARLTTPKGRNLLHAITGHNCHYLSTGEPTYWPMDLTKLPDLLDFIGTQRVPANYIQLESTFELSSDHTPVIATLSATTILKPPTPKLTTSHTNWDMFQAYINERNNLHLFIKKPTELDDATHFTTLIHVAAWHSTPTHPARMEPTINTTSIYANSSLQKGQVADGNAREIKAIGSRTTGLENNYEAYFKINMHI